MSVESNSRLVWFCITTFCDSVVNKTRATISTNGNPNQNQSCFHRTRFPALGASYMYLLRILIGSLCCLHLLRLARVTTMVLRHSIGNHCNTIHLFTLALNSDSRSKCLLRSVAKIASIARNLNRLNATGSNSQRKLYLGSDMSRANAAAAWWFSSTDLSL